MERSAKQFLLCCGFHFAITALPQPFTLVRTAATQPPAPKPPARTTLAGVYTTQQASLGKDVYDGLCQSCHKPASHTGVTFNKWWAGRRLSELFEYVSTRMPLNDPGSLAPDDNANVVAYLLKMNAMPAGNFELPADSAALAKIRIVPHTRRTRS